MEKQIRLEDTLEEQEILSNLKFIGKVQKGEKIDTKNITTQTNGLLTAFRRYMGNENREDTLTFITRVVTKSVTIYERYYTSSNHSERCLADNIYEDLTKAITGILNIQSTYSDDRAFCSRLETIKQGFTAKLNEYRSEDKQISSNGIMKLKYQ